MLPLTVAVDDRQDADARVDRFQPGRHRTNAPILKRIQYVAGLPCAVDGGLYMCPELKRADGRTIDPIDAMRRGGHHTDLDFLRWGANSAAEDRQPLAS